MSGIGATTVVVGAGGPGAQVWRPPTAVAVETPHARLVRIWDRQWEFVLQLAGNDVTRDGEIYTATMPLDHELPKWILADGAPPKRCRLTVDDGAVRWAGVLDQYEVLKVGRTGGCPECEHCQQRVMRISWIKPPEIPSMLGAMR